MSSKNLQEFDHLTPEALELLEVSGHTDTSTLFEQSFDDIFQELAKANGVLNIVDYEVTDEVVSKWLKPIEEQAGKKLAPQEPSTLPTASSLRISSAELVAALAAIPCSEEYVMEHDLKLDELPQGVIYQVSKSSATAATASSRLKSEAKAAFTSNKANKTNSSNHKSPHTTTGETKALYGKESSSVVTPLDKSRLQSMADYHNEGSHVIVPVTEKENNLTRTTKKDTNKGVKPDSIFFIKGVLHQDITRFKVGSYSLLLVNILVVSAIGILALIFVDKEEYWWAIFAPALLLPAFFIFFTSVRKSSCPICTQKMYAVKRCLKHRNAHRWPLFGYMLPTSLHALFFKWFRCIYCGTAVRLKE